MAVAALALAWLAEGLVVRLAGLTPGKGKDNNLAGWGNTLKKPTGDEAPARKFLAKRFASAPGFVTGGRGAGMIFAERGRRDRLP